MIIPLTGMYTVDISSYFCGDRFYYCPGEGKGEVQVLRNNNPIIIIRLSNATLYNCVSRSWSIIINWNVKDKLKVAVPTKICTYKYPQQQISFNGFLSSGSI